MTDRHAAYIVTLAEDIREDDASPVITALRMISGVIAVEPVVAGYPDVIARNRRDEKWHAALRRLLMNGPPEEGASR